MSMFEHSIITKDVRRESRRVWGGERELRKEKIKAHRRARRFSNHILKLFTDGRVNWDDDAPCFVPKPFLTGWDISLLKW